MTSPQRRGPIGWSLPTHRLIIVLMIGLLVFAFPLNGQRQLLARILPPNDDIVVSNSDWWPGETEPWGATQKTGSVSALSAATPNIQSNGVEHHGPGATASLPWLIMFVGPAKTASTTMQRVLTYLDQSKILEKDNYFYLGRSVNPARWSPVLEVLVRQLEKKKCKSMKSRTDCWNHYAAPILDDLHLKKKNVIIYEEWLSNPAIGNSFQNFQDATNGKFRVVIVVGYRQLWNWLPSRKNEWEKKGSKEWPTRPLSPVEATTLPWNVSAANRRPVAARPFFMAATLAKNDDGHFSGTIGTLQQYQSWDWAEIRILNFHQGDIVSHFLCDVLPDASHSCGSSQAASSSVQSSYPSVDLTFPFIAVEAADRGFIDTERCSLKKAVAIIEKCSHGLPPIPRECLDKTSLEHLLEKSINIEREIVGNFSETSPYLLDLVSQEAEERQRQNFWRSTLKFCSPNVTSIMEDADWRRCFLSCRA